MIGLKRPRTASVVAALALAALLAVPGARADHAHGSGPTSARGTVPLGPAGGGADVATLSLSAIGIVVSSGDALRYSWSVANASGVSVTFQLFAHGFVLHLVYVNTTAPQASGQWQVPGSDTYYASFANPTTRAVNVTYAFDGVPASDPTVAIIVGTLIMVAIFSYVGISARGILREARAAKPHEEAAAVPSKGAGEGASEGSAQSRTE